MKETSGSFHERRRSHPMSSVAQIEKALKQILEEQAPQLARETGFIERERQLRGADFAQILIFGWLQEPEMTLDGLSQLAQIREVSISAPGLSQRFRETKRIKYPRKYGILQTEQF